MEITKIIKPNILALQPYSSARDEYTGNEGIFLDANENPYDFDHARYPDPYQRKLKVKLSEVRNVPYESIFIGNGSDEIIDLLIRITCEPGEDRILSLDPSYGMYKVSAAINKVQIDLVAMDGELNVDEYQLNLKLKDEPKIVFICSPNNPNGGLIPQAIIEQVLEKANGLVVIDEAYIDFADTESWVSRIAEHDNLLVLQTFSKAWAGAGLRIGMAFAQPWLVSILNKVKPPYNISSPAQELALERLADLPKLKASIELIKEQRKRLEIFLSQLDIVEKVFPSQANFLLARFQDADKVMEYLTAHKIIVRNRSNQNRCKSTIRISVGNQRENDELINLLLEFQNKKS